MKWNHSPAGWVNAERYVSQAGTLAKMEIPSDDFYGQRMLTWLEGFAPHLWANFDRIPELSRSSEILAGFLEMACRSTHVRNITLGRHAIWSMPKDWTIGQIEQAADETLDLSDEWEFRRLLEVYDKLDHDLLKRLIARGSDSKNEEIREAATDFTR